MYSTTFISRFYSYGYFQVIISFFGHLVCKHGTWFVVAFAVVAITIVAVSATTRKTRHLEAVDMKKMFLGKDFERKPNCVSQVCERFIL